MLRWRNLTWKHLFILLLLLHLAPLWVFTYFPSQDGPEPSIIRTFGGLLS